MPSPNKTNPALTNLEQFTRTTPNGTLTVFSGHKGSGREQAAKGIATRLKMPFVKINLKQVTSKFIGETEKNLEKAFNGASKNGAVLFFDEADALFGSRTQVKDAHDKYANQETSYLLQRVERFKGLVVLSTNSRNNIDQAALRRTRHVLQFPI